MKRAIPLNTPFRSTQAKFDTTKTLPNLYDLSPHDQEIFGRRIRFIKEMDRILRMKDPTRLREYLFFLAEAFESGYAKMAEAGDLGMKITMHHLILLRPTLEDLHAESRRWLLDRGIDPHWIPSQEEALKVAEMEKIGA